MSKFYLLALLTLAFICVVSATEKSKDLKEKNEEYLDLKFAPAKNAKRTLTEDEDTAGDEAGNFLSTKMFFYFIALCLVFV